VRLEHTLSVKEVVETCDEPASEVGGWATGHSVKNGTGSRKIQDQSGNRNEGTITNATFDKVTKCMCSQEIIVCPEDRSANNAGTAIEEIRFVERFSTVDRNNASQLEGKALLSSAIARVNVGRAESEENYFSGCIDEVRIWGIGRRDGQIQYYRNHPQRCYRSG
jgi:hypothetical protein